MTGQTAHLIQSPWHGDPLAALAARILSDHHAKLPDLSQVTVLLPDNSTARQLRQRLLTAATREGHSALLGPRLLSLGEWSRQFLPEGIHICDDASRELQLIEALLQQADLLGGANPWSLAESLLQLFDELTLNQIRLPEKEVDFSRQLAEAYRLVDTSLTAFGHEARIVHRLWQAWQQQLSDQQQIDVPMAYVLALSQAHGKLNNQSLYLAGYEFHTKAEREWLARLGQSTAVTILETVAHDPDKPLSDFSRCLNAVYTDPDQPLQERARAFAAETTASPLQSRLWIYSAANHEQEARAVDVQVRRWLLAGKQHIGIVTENRRLARRVRALLERAGIPLEDASGWALSTTSAAAALEALLQCLEEDFSHIPFLDLLKSPFIFADLEPKSVDNSIYRLEQDIILQEKIARGLSRYRHHLLRRRQRLPDWMPEVSPVLLAMLDRFDSVSGKFHPLLKGAHPATAYLDALTDSLAQLAIEPAMAADAAGQRILQTLDSMAHGARETKICFTWLDFRSWLGRQLELANFKPADSGSPVRLMGLAQSNLQMFDALIIASAEEEFLPGQSQVSPFFNQAVRRELGLVTQSEQRQLRFHYFRRLLESSHEILITLRSEQDGEPVTPSPWLARLQAFHQLAWGETLQAGELPSIIASPQSQVVCRDSRPLPQPEEQPRPAVTASNLPDHISASDYQLLMDCPYHFFAARCLRLAAPETISEELAKADYGQRVHRCLEAFHSGVSGLPGPFQQALTPDHRQQAIDMLTGIARQVFADDLSENFAHRAWLHLWESLIPAYIDWQARRETEWRVSTTEQQREIDISPTLRIKGRIDRIDRAADRLAIIDYKTGAIASDKEIIAGEAVQLPFYALLNQDTAQPVTRVEYLRLEKPDKVGSAGVLEGTELQELAQQIEQRLLTMMQELNEGAGLPAWPDEKKCARCDMQTLCRRQVWQDT